MSYTTSTLEALHRLAFRHRHLVEASARCGCFYCLATFAPASISEWVDGDDPAGTTALCPHCEIDSVIPEQPEHPLTPELLAAMRTYWFK